MISKIEKGIKNPQSVMPYLKRQLLFGGNTILQRKLKGKEGINVMDEDWDNLIILDACRFDAFEQVQDQLNGELSKVISPGSSSVEWIRETFSDENFYDTVYITANPYVEIETDDQFHQVINAWNTHWNDEFNTVLPEDLVAVSKKAEKDYPNKRLIIQFMQPHRPFIGNEGRDLEDTKGNIGHRKKALGEDYTWEKDNIFERLKKGEIDRDTVLEAYMENLNVVLPHVQDLLESLQGKSVVTADHGNGFGEKPPGCFGEIYAHPSNVYAPQLVEVPWFVVDGQRKRIIDTPPDYSKENNDGLEKIEDRLEKLGYR